MPIFAVLPPQPPPHHAPRRHEVVGQPFSHHAGLLGFHYNATLDVGRITAVLNERKFDFHIDAKQGYSRSLMGALLDRIEGMGYEPIPEDECEPELLDNGATRIYLVPVQTNMEALA